MLFQRSCATLVALLRKPVSSANMKSTNFALLRFASTQAQTKDSQNTGSYRFTLDNNLMSKEQRDFYEENGYIIVKNMVEQKDLDRWAERFNDYATGKIKPDAPELLLQKELKVAKDNLNVNTLYKIGELYADEVLFEYCKYDKVLDYVQCFTGPNIMAIHTMLINKPPDTGSKSSRHPLHQDIHYFPNRPADRIVCAWTAMERINRDNGCLVAIPGTHKGDHLEHQYPEWEGGVNKLYYGVKDFSVQDARVHLIMEAGDTVLFHPHLIHGSGMNRTKGFRKAISCHYAPVPCEFIDVQGTIQQELADETLATLSKKFGGQKIDYATFWKLRARLVRGEGYYEM